MGVNDNLQLVIEVDVTKANAEIKSVNSALAGIGSEGQRSGALAGNGLTQIERSAISTHAKLRLLTSEFGIHLPQSIVKMVSEVSSLQKVINIAFAATSVYVLARALAEVPELFDKIIEKVTGWDDAAKKAYQSQIDLNHKAIEATYELAKAQRELNEVGLKGVELAATRQANTLADFRAQADLATKIQRELNTLAAERKRLEATKEPALLGGLVPAGAFPAFGLLGAERGSAEWKAAVEGIAEIDAKAKLLQETLNKISGPGGSLTKMPTEATKAAKETALALQETLDHIQEQNKTLTNLDRQLYAGKPEAHVPEVKVGLGAPGVAADYIARTKEINETARNIRGLEIAAIPSRQRGYAEIEFNAANEMADLRKQYLTLPNLMSDEEYERARVAIAQRATNERIELIKQEGREIESLYDRTIGSAKSAADALKNIWHELASYWKHQIFDMIAASLHGGGGITSLGGAMGLPAIFPAVGAAAGGVANAGVGSGGTFGGGAVNGNPAIFSAFPGGGAVGGSAGGTGGSGIGGIAGSALKSNLKNFLGLNNGSTLVGNLLTSPAAGVAGLALLSTGARGFKGLAANTAGGFLTGASVGFALGGPVGAGIGALIGTGGGFIKGLFGFGESPEDHARKLIKQAYKIDIPDKSFLSQVVAIAQQAYGGAISVAVQSQQVRELVQLYAMSTGQRGNFPAQMQALGLVQSGGNISALPSYSNGAASSLSSLNISRGAGGGITVVVQNQIPGDRVGEYMSGKVVETITREPRVVQNSVANAERGSAGRRERAARLLVPGLLTS